jgi:hypothetical protein
VKHFFCRRSRLQGCENDKPNTLQQSQVRNYLLEKAKLSPSLKTPTSLPQIHVALEINLSFTSTRNFHFEIYPQSRKSIE